MVHYTVSVLIQLIIMKTFIYIFLAGGLGSIIRYGIDLWITQGSVAKFPFATFVVNILGCILIGIFYTLSERYNYSMEIRLLLTVGFCGGFTTFSSFSYEGFSLIKSGDFGLYTAYVIGSVVSGTAAVFFGAWLFKR